MTSAEKLSIAGPVVSLVIAAGTAVTAISGLIANLGLRPFWADVSTSVVFFVLVLYWLRLTFQQANRKPETGFVKRAVGARSAWRNVSILHLCFVAVFFGFFIWCAYPAFSHILNPTWKICGTITGNCAPSYCVVGLDARSRPIFPECVAPLDSSGYLVLVPIDYTTYRPITIRIQCAGKDLRILRLPNEFMSPKCNGRIDMQ